MLLPSTNQDPGFARSQDRGLTESERILFRCLLKEAKVLVGQCGEATRCMQNEPTEWGEKKVALLVEVPESTGAW